MKIMLSSLENCRMGRAGGPVAPEDMASYLIRNGVKLRYNLMSYYYIRTRVENACHIRDNSIEVMIDSGAHSLRHGVKVDFEKYTREYAEFIKKFDRPNVVGYFEMDIDNIVGHDEVLRLRKILEQASDKIIPVWHPNRGIDEFRKMCEDYSGKIVSITGFGRIEIKDEQFPMFLSYAHKCGCKLHCLGMTRKAILDKVPFDYVDSSSWKQEAIYGRVCGRKGKVTLEYSKDKYGLIEAANYKYWTGLQDKYYQKWRKVCKD